MKLAILEHDADSYRKQLEQLVKIAQKQSLTDLQGASKDPVKLANHIIKALISTRTIINDNDWWNNMYNYWNIEPEILNKFKNTIYNKLKIELKAAVENGVVIESANSGGGFLSTILNIAKLILTALFGQENRHNSRYGRYGNPRYNTYGNQRYNQGSNPGPNSNQQQSDQNTHPLWVDATKQSTFKLASLNQYIVYEFVRMCKEHLDKSGDTGDPLAPPDSQTDPQADQSTIDLPNANPDQTPGSSPSVDPSAKTTAQNTTNFDNSGYRHYMQTRQSSQPKRWK